MEEWKNGRMEDWRNGRLEEWKIGITPFHLSTIPSSIIPPFHLFTFPSFHHSTIPLFQKQRTLKINK